MRRPPLRHGWFLLVLAGLSAGATFPSRALGGEFGPGRPATPTVVNGVFPPPATDWVSLDGPWEFATDPDQRGEVGEWFRPGRAWPGQRTLMVPGCWEAQGVGGVGRSLNTTPEIIPVELRGNYVGAAWYRRGVRIPAEWAGRQIWLKIGGVNAQGWFFVNGTYVGHLHSYCGTYKFNITDFVTPNETATVVVEVRNDVPSAKGMMNWVHRFGGLYRSVELEATPEVFIDEVYTEPDLDAGAVRVQVQVRHVRPGTDRGPLALEVSARTLDGQPAGRSRTEVAPGFEETAWATVVVRLDPFRAWSPEEPFLYRADVRLLRQGAEVHRSAQRFGVRQWEVRGADLYLNNHRFFLRGYGDDYIYPLTLASPPYREVHRRHLKLAREYGFNYVRHHTHCEVPEFFEAADEAGVMVQPELPYYGSTAAGGREVYRPRQDAEELATHYRRFVSFATYCTGNEGQLPPPLDAELFTYFRTVDPSRVAIHQDGGINTPANSQYGFFCWLGEVGTVHSRHRRDARTVAGPGEIRLDYSRPLVLHEYLNLAADLDARLGPRYTGAVLPVRGMDAYEKELGEVGLSRAWGDACLEAGNRQQRYWQKVGLEAGRLDDELDGQIYWTILDVGYPSAQGLLNQFWEPKASSPAYFRQFNDTTVLLAEFDPPHGILEGGDSLTIRWFVSHYGSRALTGALDYRLVTTMGQVLAQGTVTGLEIQPGGVRGVATNELPLPRLDAAAKLVVLGEIPGAAVRNSWETWLFPGRVDPALGRGVVATRGLDVRLRERYPELAEWDPAATDERVIVSETLGARELKALARGKVVLSLGARGPKTGHAFGWWWKNNQTGTAVAHHHPAFAGFPADDHLTPVFHRVLGHTQPLGHGVFRKAQPLMLSSGAAGYLAHAAEARVGEGRLLVTGLDLRSDLPEAAALFECFLRYVKSDAFRPAGEMDVEALERLQRFFTGFNGYGRTVKTTERWDYNSPLGVLPLCFVRATDGTPELVWETQPVPADVNRAGTHTFAWLAATGWFTQPDGQFSLFLGEKKLVDFAVAKESTRWTSPDGAVVLDYQVTDLVKFEQDTAGRMELTLPAAWLTPGQPGVLRVTGSRSDSKRWFGLYEVEP